MQQMLFGAVKRVFLGGVLVRNILEAGGTCVWMAERCQIRVVHRRLENFFFFLSNQASQMSMFEEGTRTLARTLPSQFWESLANS